MTLRRRRGPCWFLNYTSSSGLGETKKPNCIIDSQLGQTELFPWGIVVQVKRVIEPVPRDQGACCSGTTESKVTHLKNATTAHTGSRHWPSSAAYGDAVFCGSDAVYSWNKHAQICVLLCLCCTGEDNAGWYRHRNRETIKNRGAIR